MELPITETNRYKLVKLLGGCCRICLNDKPQDLELDHIYNDGEEERTKYGNSEKIWYFYLQNELLAFKRIQPLCKDCHHTKHNIINDESDDYKYLYERAEQHQRFKEIILRITSIENGISEQNILSNVLLKDYTKEQILNYLRRFLREADIYECKPGYFKKV